MEGFVVKVLDLFSGLGGWAESFRARGHEVLTLDFEAKFGCDFTADILDWDVNELPDGWIGADDFLVVASPPCTAFTVLQIGRNWWPKEGGPNGELPHSPKTPAAVEGLRILERTLAVIEELKPGLGWIIENPVGKMRRIPMMESLPRTTVSYCRYGLPVMKPTDLWSFGNWTAHWTPRGVCDSRLAPVVEVDGMKWVTDRTTGKACHVQAVRGSTTGIQGKLSAEERSRIPDELSTEVCVAAEAALSGKVVRIADRGPEAVTDPLTLF